MRNLAVILSWRLLLLLACCTPPARASLSLQMWSNRSCSAPLSSPVFPSLSLPSLVLSYNSLLNSTCVPSSGVSGRAGVQWLAYWCPVNQTGFYGGMYVYEFDYSLADGSCPFVRTNSGNQNWSVFSINPVPSAPSCFSTSATFYNATLGRSQSAYVYSTFSCGPSVLPNHAEPLMPTGRLTTALLLLSSLLIAFVLVV